MIVVKPEKYRVLGYNIESNGVKRPILKMSDAYMSSHPRAKKLINRVFDRHIYGKFDQKTHDNGVLISKQTSNYQELEQILKKYENQDEDYNIENQEVNMDE